MFFYAFYGIIIFAGTAMMVREGLWSNAISLINILVSGLAAFGLYQPLVIWLDEKADGEHTYWLDFAVLWALYVVFMVIFRALTGAASRTRMRFKHPIDAVGGPLVGLIAAWVLAAFTLATLHTAPMAGKDAFGGNLVQSSNVATASMISSPDAAWLRFFEKMSNAAALGSGSTDKFGAKGFTQIYADRRDAFGKAESFIVKRN